MPDLPNNYERFQREHPDVWQAYDQLGAAVHADGPLDERVRQLVKLGIAIGCQSEGAVHSHARKALAAGASKEAIGQVALLSLPTIGFPNMMAGLSWVGDVLSETP